MLTRSYSVRFIVIHAMQRVVEGKFADMFNNEQYLRSDPRAPLRARKGCGGRAYHLKNIGIEQ